MHDSMCMLVVHQDQHEIELTGMSTTLLAQVERCECDNEYN